MYPQNDPQNPYGQQQFPQYPQQPPPRPYGLPYQQPYPQPPQPQQPLASGDLGAFFDQPSSGGGPSLKFMNRPIGTSYTGTVARRVSNADVQQQTDTNGRGLTYKDSRPKLQMLVPLDVPESAEYPDGRAVWYVKSQARDELTRAMAEAGAPAGPPEAGAVVKVTLTGHRQIPGLSMPQFIYAVEYTRPAGAAPDAGVMAQPAPPAPNGGQQAAIEHPSQQTAPVVPAATGQQVPSLTAEEQQLIARLTGQQQ